VCVCGGLCVSMCVRVCCCMCMFVLRPPWTGVSPNSHAKLVPTILHDNGRSLSAKDPASVVWDAFAGFCNLPESMRFLDEGTLFPIWTDRQESKGKSQGHCQQSMPIDMELASLRLREVELRAEASSRSVTADLWALHVAHTYEGDVVTAVAKLLFMSPGQRDHDLELSRTLFLLNGNS
jgi:hypothetical protein